jgi:hypothetical protein
VKERTRIARVQPGQFADVLKTLFIDGQCEQPALTQSA